jgi:hypothetical protein
MRQTPPTDARTSATALQTQDKQRTTRAASAVEEALSLELRALLLLMATVMTPPDGPTLQETAAHGTKQTQPLDALRMAMTIQAEDKLQMMLAACVAEAAMALEP